MSKRFNHLLAAAACTALLAGASGAYADTISLTADYAGGPTFSTSGGNANTSIYLVIDSKAGAAGTVGFTEYVDYSISDFSGVSNASSALCGNSTTCNEGMSPNWSLFGTIQFSGTGSWITGTNFQSEVYAAGGSLTVYNATGTCGQTPILLSGPGTALPAACGTELTSGVTDTSFNRNNSTFNYTNADSDPSVSSHIYDTTGLGYDLSFALSTPESTTKLDKSGVHGNCPSGSDTCIESTTEGSNQWAPVPVPEPASLSLLGGGLVAFGAWRRRRSRKA